MLFRSDLGVIDLATGVGTRITDTRLHESTPCWSPDGQWIVYSVSRVGSLHARLAVCRSDGSGQRYLAPANSRQTDVAPSYSPDGQWVYFARSSTLRGGHMGGRRWYGWDTYRMRPADGLEERLTAIEEYSPPAPRPLLGGGFLFDCIEADPAAQAGIRSVVRHAQPAGELTTVPLASASHGFPLPDGKRLVYISDSGRPFAYEVHVARLDGTGAMQLTEGLGRCQTPVCSVDGQAAFFLRELLETRGFEIWKVMIDSGRKRMVMAQSDLARRWPVQRRATNKDAGESPLPGPGDGQKRK